MKIAIDVAIAQFRVIGKGSRMASSRSRIKKIIVRMKNWIENGIFVSFETVMPHSNGDGMFLEILFVFIADAEMYTRINRISLAVIISIGMEIFLAGLTILLIGVIIVNYTFYVQ